MKKLLTVGLILSLSIGSAQARTGGFKPSIVSQATQAQIERVLKQVQQQAKKAANEVAKFQKQVQKNPAAKDALTVAIAKERRTRQLVKQYQNQLNQAIGRISPF